MGLLFRRRAATRSATGGLGRAALLAGVGATDSRARRMIVNRFVRGDSRRWIAYLLLSALWSRYRKLSRREPELLYAGTFGPGTRFAMATSRPLPRRLRTRRVRRAIEAAARADLA